ncbi:MAG: MucR family transcriptional regulator [Magnetococcus sp. YQC-9]
MSGFGIISLSLVIGYIVTRMTLDKQSAPPSSVPASKPTPPAALPAPVPPATPPSDPTVPSIDPLPSAAVHPAPIVPETGATPAASPAAAPVMPVITAEGIVCLVCGQSFKGLRAHITRAHQLTAELYRTRFGLPEDAPMALPTVKSASPVAPTNPASVNTATPKPVAAKPAIVKPTRSRSNPKTS